MGKDISKEGEDGLLNLLLSALFLYESPFSIA